MKQIRICFSISVFLLIYALPASGGEGIDQSIVRLIANPGVFDGKIIRVIGFVRLEFEGNAVYLQESDYRARISKNALWVDINEDIKGERKKFDRKYVLIQGKFDGKRTGHKGAFSGTIKVISRFEVWEWTEGEE